MPFGRGSFNQLEFRCSSAWKTILFGVMAVLFGLQLVAAAQTLRFPFDFSQSEIAIDATVNGQPVYILLYTGVDPSAIDLENVRRPCT